MVARELIKKRLYLTDDGEPQSVHDSVDAVESVMIEYATHQVETHVEELLNKILINLSEESKDIIRGAFYDNINIV